MSTELTSLNIETKVMRVTLKVDNELSVFVSLPRPEADIDSLTIGQIKQMAIEAAKQKIP